MDNTEYDFSSEERKLLDLFLNYLTKDKKKERVDEVEVEEEPSLNPILIRLNDKDLEVVDSMMKSDGFKFTSQIFMIHLILSNPSMRHFENEEELVEYLMDIGGLEMWKVSEILQSYNRVKDQFSNGKSIGEIPSEYLENRTKGIREYSDGKKVLKWKGLS